MSPCTCIRLSPRICMVSAYMYPCRASNTMCQQLLCSLSVALLIGVACVHMTCTLCTPSVPPLRIAVAALVVTVHDPIVPALHVRRAMPRSLTSPFHHWPPCRRGSVIAACVGRIVHSATPLISLVAFGHTWTCLSSGHVLPLPV